MINLIPIEEKKRMKKEFFLRLSAVVFFALGSCFLVASAALLPAYFLTMAKTNSVARELSLQKSEPLPETSLEIDRTVADLDAKLTLIENLGKDTFLISNRVINEVVLKRMKDIKITEIFYENAPGKGKSIGITGTAPSRERLLLFRQALEDSASFKSIDLPISNFIRGSNIQFYLKLTPA